MLVLAAVLTGCAAGPDVHAQDHAVLWPTLRLHWRRDEQPRTGPGANSLVAEGTYGQGNYSRGDGRYELFALQTRAQVLAVGAADGPLCAHVLGGAEYLYLGLDDPRLVGGTFDSGAFGPMLGLRGSWNALPGTWLYARGTAAGLIPDTTSLRAEAGVSAWPADGIELFAGYQWWRVRRENPLDGLLTTGSDIDLHTDGIVFGVGVVF